MRPRTPAARAQLARHRAVYWNARVTCGSFKWGEYDALRCARPAGHTGEHNYVVANDVILTNEKEAA